MPYPLHFCASLHLIPTLILCNGQSSLCSVGEENEAERGEVTYQGHKALSERLGWKPHLCGSKSPALAPIPAVPRLQIKKG